MLFSQQIIVKLSFLLLNGAVRINSNVCLKTLLRLLQGMKPFQPDSLTGLDDITTDADAMIISCLQEKKVLLFLIGIHFRQDWIVSKKVCTLNKNRMLLHLGVNSHCDRWISFSAVTNAGTMVNGHWLAVILSTRWGGKGEGSWEWRDSVGKEGDTVSLGIFSSWVMANVTTLPVLITN